MKTKLLERFEVNVCSNMISKAIGSFFYSFKRVYFIPERWNTLENIDVRFNVSMRSMYGWSPQNSIPSKAVLQYSQRISACRASSQEARRFILKSQKGHSTMSFVCVCVSLKGKSTGVESNNPPLLTQ
ncbi:hypothetical protein RF11_10767 [Thelohanellus kitauei]|uniref:Uncharacterized protein n=1 Tax=Thelohanellus kitauei TaxID=669202 RepID=A0A0C2MD13_THEKT|nr:hypothetical protein RF11_10767 [Thelohanellus kitauei]